MLLAGLCLLPACVTRSFSVESDPPGAEVRLDGLLVGTTPYREEFISYGVRTVDLRLDGHLRDVREFDLERPWWQYFPFDVVADLLWPAELHDDHALKVELAPRTPGSTSWADAQAAYERFQAARAAMRAAAARFAGREPEGRHGDHAPRPGPQSGSQPGQQPEEPGHSR